MAPKKQKKTPTVFDKVASLVAEASLENNWQHMLDQQGTNWTAEYDKLSDHGTNTLIAENSPLGDGDQSALRSMHPNGEFHRNIFCSGGDIDDILQSQTVPPPTFPFLCFMGNVAGVSAALEACSSPHEKRVLLETRLGIMRFSPLFLTISGMRKLSQTDGEPVLDHVGTAKLLLDQGARPDARDLLGKTPLHYICGPLNNCLKFFALGDHLIEAGTQKGIKLVDAVDRFHAVPMLQAVQMNRPDICAWLVKNNADATIRDDAGCSAVSMSELIPAIKRIVMKATNAGIAKIMSENATPEQVRVNAPLVESVMCWKCEAREGNSLCAGCGEARYCGRECQMSHWKEGGHKASCRKECYSVKPDPQYSGKLATNMGNRQMPKFWGGEIPKGIAIGELFEIKIQVGLNITTPFLIYDEKRKFSISARAEFVDGGAALFAKVQQFPAWGGRKAFFRASFQERGKLSIRAASLFARSW